MATIFPKHVHQRRLTPPQREYLSSKLTRCSKLTSYHNAIPAKSNAYLLSPLLRKLTPTVVLLVKNCSIDLTTNAWQLGLRVFQTSLLGPSKSATATAPPAQKWRICQNYGALNKVTEIAPMPQGDIRAKQQLLSGHRWISVFDFASGFYAVSVAEESRPYTCFYVEGRGYFQYKRMPFGLTGAPSTFAQLTATHLHDLLADGSMELFVDDGATAGDDF